MNHLNDVELQEDFYTAYQKWRCHTCCRTFFQWGI